MLDVREFFHCSVKELSDSELFAMILDLVVNPASRFGMKLRGWNRRVTPTQITLEDLWNAVERSNYLFLTANSKDRPKDGPNVYPSAWQTIEEKQKDRKVKKMTAEQAREHYTNLAKKRDASITAEEIHERNKEFIKREEIKNGKHGPQE